MGKRILVFVLSLLCLVVIFENSVSKVSPVKADGPEGILKLHPLIVNKEIVSCSSPLARSRCRDGTCSTSTGRGTCSGHGGVAGSVDNSSGGSSPEPPVSSLPPEEPESSSQDIDLEEELSDEEPASEQPSPEQPQSNESSIASPPNSEATSPTEIPQSGGILSNRANWSLIWVSSSILFIILSFGVKQVWRGSE